MTDKNNVEYLKQKFKTAEADELDDLEKLEAELKQIQAIESFIKACAYQVEEPQPMEYLKKTWYITSNRKQVFNRL